MLTQREQVAALGAALGRELRVETRPLEEARAEYAALTGTEFTDTALAHWATRVDQPERAADRVQQALGRSPRPFGQWAFDHAEDFARRTTAEVAPAYAEPLGGGDMEQAA